MNITPQTLVVVCKIYAADYPAVKSSIPSEWKAGGENPNLSPYLGYEVKGYVQGPIQSGLPLTLLRTERNGVAATGVFQTSPLRAVNQIPGSLVLWTANSVYELRICDPD